MPLLKVDQLNVFYGDLQVLFDISLRVEEGSIVSIVGANAAGKSTLLRSISGLIRNVTGSIALKGEQILGLPPYSIVGKGVVHVPEGRRVFPLLSVQENLEIGAYSQRKSINMKGMLDEVYGVFPALASHKSQLAGSLSGGEQQMLAIARGLMARPILLTIDEPSLGLAPLMVEKTFETLHAINREQVTILLVEQNVVRALKLSQQAYALENGRIVMEGPGEELLGNEHLKRAYMGI
ncbi:MAG: ABC transporter ATP-binding protein [Deltaproteobacteria bacterium]|nr:ABC transporter ATP-binding protein [Deltaproteobacteria bacterium]MBW2137570.1 ABC transporter ATP-binding protein [Deltaproteobacteria bacterium]